MFQVLSLQKSQFSELSDLSNIELQNRGIYWLKADAYPAFPCRVSLDFAQIGEEVFLMNYHHHKTNSPFASNYAIYVRKNAQEANLDPNVLPKVFMRETPIAIRAFDKMGFLKSAEIAMGPQTAPVFERLLENPQIEYLHTHYAAYGCFAAKVIRA